MTRRGWLLRNEIIWHKPNGMPESVQDRFTVDFEKLFFFSKSEHYYFEQQFDQWAESASHVRNKRCVWSIPTKQFPDAHFAVYPKELIETPVTAGCPELVCKECGPPKEKVYVGAEKTFAGQTDCDCDGRANYGLILYPHFFTTSPGD